jgi:hypothetical protein
LHLTYKSACSAVLYSSVQVLVVSSTPLGGCSTSLLCPHQPKTGMHIHDPASHLSVPTFQPMRKRQTRLNSLLISHIMDLQCTCAQFTCGDSEGGTVTVNHFAICNAGLARDLNAQARHASLKFGPVLTRIRKGHASTSFFSSRTTPVSIAAQMATLAAGKNRFPR